MKERLINSLKKAQMRQVISVLRPGAKVDKMNKTKCIAILQHYSYNAIKDALDS